MLPAFTSEQQTGCPTNLLEVSAASDSVTAVAALKAPELVDGSYVVKPDDQSVHQQVSFYIKVSAVGGASAFFGPYELNIGCAAESVTISDSASF